MTIEFRYSFTCPHCGTKNEDTYRPVANYSNPKVIYCDIESGGCDQLLVIQHKLSMETSIRTVNDTPKLEPVP